MPKVTEEHRQAMRERIHEAVMEIARQVGVQGFSMGELIRESGLSAGAIYGYYRSKEDIVAATGARILETQALRLDGLADEAPLPSVAEVVARVADALPRDLLASGLLLEVWSMAPREPAFKSLVAEAYSVLLKRFSAYAAALGRSRGMDEEQAAAWGEKAAPVIAGLCQGYVVQASVLGPEGAQRYLDALVAVNPLSGE